MPKDDRSYASPELMNALSQPSESPDRMIICVGWVPNLPKAVVDNIKEQLWKVHLGDIMEEKELPLSDREKAELLELWEVDDAIVEDNFQHLCPSTPDTYKVFMINILTSKGGV